MLAIVVTLLYPLAIWLGHGHVEPRYLAALLVLAALLRVFTLKDGSARWWLTEKEFDCRAGSFSTILILKDDFVTVSN